MNRRDVLKAAAILPAAGIVPTGAAEAVEAVPAVHVDDQGLVREIEAMEATLARLKGIVRQAAEETPFERSGLHYDARCTIGTLRVQLDMMELESDQVYIPLVRQVREGRAAPARTSPKMELTPDHYLAYAASARHKRESIQPDTAEGRFRVAYLLLFEDSMHRLAQDPTLSLGDAFAANARDRVELARMFGVEL